MTTSKTPAIVRDFAAIDATETELAILHTTRLDQQKQLATTILKRKVKDLHKDIIIEEADRLIVIAKTIVKEAGYETQNKHEMKNCWSIVKNIMIQRMTAKHAPKLAIKVEAGKDDKGNIVTDKVLIKDLPETTKKIANNAAKIKKALNPESTDGRGNNSGGGKTKNRGANTTPKTELETVKPSSTQWEETICMTFGIGKKYAGTVQGVRDFIENSIKHRKVINRYMEEQGFWITEKPEK
jgi:hypothetical protein